MSTATSSSPDSESRGHRLIAAWVIGFSLLIGGLVLYEGSRWSAGRGFMLEAVAATGLCAVLFVSLLVAVLFGVCNRLRPIRYLPVLIIPISGLMVSRLPSLEGRVRAGEGELNRIVDCLHRGQPWHQMSGSLTLERAKLEEGSAYLFFDSNSDRYLCWTPNGIPPVSPYAHATRVTGHWFILKSTT